MHQLRKVRALFPIVAFCAFLAGASVVLRSDEPNTTVGGKLIDEMKQMDEAHTAEMRKLRSEVRTQLKIVRRARLDPSAAADAAAAPAKISASLNKLLDTESAYRTKLEGIVIAKRDVLIAELSQQMAEGKEAAPGLMSALFPTVCSTESEKTEWADLFKLVKRNPRFDEGGTGGGGDDDEGFD